MYLAFLTSIFFTVNISHISLSWSYNMTFLFSLGHVKRPVNDDSGGSGGNKNGAYRPKVQCAGLSLSVVGPTWQVPIA